MTSPLMISDRKGSKILVRLQMFLISFALFGFGCSPHEPVFSPNQLLTHRMESELQADLNSIQSQVQVALVDFFGSPDQPHWPASIASDPRWKSMADSAELEFAAGPVQRDKKKVERGLFRKHCAQCHGITGDGLGPAAALLNPYPRDFRRGSFKFKSTPQGAKPTHSDLVRTIEQGIPGTSMPSMANLAKQTHYDNAISKLAGYVRFLSIRGEVERKIMIDLVRDIDIDKGETLYDPLLKASDPTQFSIQTSRIDAVIQRVANTWIEPPVPEALPVSPLRFDVTQLTEKSDRDLFLNSATRGSQLFQGEIAACWQCHGKDGAGQGKLIDFDEWTKDWTIRAGIDPKDPKQWKPLRKIGLLKPTPSVARNLHLGVFRAGSSPESIYRTIIHGIDGTPMPAAARTPSVKNGLNEEQIWDLVNYCLSLSALNLKRIPEANHAE